MRSKTYYSSEEINQIRQLLREKIQSSRSIQKSIRNKIRAIGFYISDFKSSKYGFTEDDFNLLLENGIIKQHNKSESVRRNKFIDNRIMSIIKENPYKTLMLIISSITLLLVWLNYQSPPKVKCEMVLVQRPDSVYQAQIHVWNEGNKPAKNIILLANKEQIFKADTAKKSKKLNLQVYPYLSVTSELTPSKVLDRTGKVIPFKKHRIKIENLPECCRDENIFILVPPLGSINKLIKKMHSIFKKKYINLHYFSKYSSYILELENNIQLSAEGRILNIEVTDIIDINHVDSTSYYFPTQREISNYRKYAIAPYYTIPPLQIMKKIKEEQENGRSGFKGFKRYKGFKRW